MTPFLEVVVGVAGLVLAAFFIWFAKALLSAVARFNQIFGDWTGEPARPGVSARPGVMARLETVEGIARDTRSEVFRNGGNSLRDAVDRAAADIAEHRRVTPPAIMQLSTDVVQIGTDVADVLERINKIEDERAAREEGTPT